VEHASGMRVFAMQIGHAVNTYSLPGHTTHFYDQGAQAVIGMEERSDPFTKFY